MSDAANIVDATPLEVLPPAPREATLAALRPSSLAALAQCPRYMGDPTGSVHTERGHRMDTAFRVLLDDRQDLQALADKDQALFYLALSPIERGNVEWAVRAVRTFAGGTRILCDEKDCKVEVPGLPNGGTCDAVLPELFKHLDLKSGQVHDYTEQMAAYALGFMDARFVDEWTAILLFCDARQAVVVKFTYEQARGIVERILAGHHDPNAKATPCDYCGWCALRLDCSARKRLAAQSVTALALTEESFKASILNDPEKLAAFIAGCKELKDYNETARAHAKAILLAGGTVPGFRLQTRVGSEFLQPADVVSYFPGLTPEQIAEAYGDMSKGQFEEAWKTHRGAESIPANALTRGPSISFVAKAKKEKQEKPKTKTKKNTK